MPENDIQLLDAPEATPAGVLAFQKQIHDKFNRLVERAKAGRNVTQDEWSRVEEAMADFGTRLEAVQAVAQANAGRISGGASDAVIVQQSRMILEPHPDVRVDPVYFNIMALTPEELCGVSEVGQRHAIPGLAPQVRDWTGGRAFSVSLVQEVQRDNDLILFKHVILMQKNARYRASGSTDLDRMKTLREWKRYEKNMETLHRALNSGTGSQGGFLIPTILSSSVGDMMEAPLKVAALFPRFPMTSKFFEWPFKLSRATAYKVTEFTGDGTDTGVPASQMALRKPVWTAQDVAAFTVVADDIDESGITSISAMAGDDLFGVIGHAIEDATIHGELDAATMDGTTFNPAGPPVSAKRLWRGLRFNALMTASYPAAISAGSALTFAQAISLREKMGTWGGDPTQLAWIVGYRGWSNLMGVTDGSSGGRLFNNNTDFGAGAPLLRGQIGTFLGSPVILSEKLVLLNSAGKFDATPANNTKGLILLANRKRYAYGDHRTVTVESSKEYLFRQFQEAIRAKARLDFQSLDSDAAVTGGLAASATPVGLIYNLT